MFVCLLTLASLEETARQQLASRPFWRAVFMEFMSTALFVIIGVGSVLSGGELDHSFTPARLLVVGTAFGYAIVVLAYSSAAISGAHFNPAVTFALVLTRKIGIVRGIFYFAAQVCGGIVGAFLIRAAIPQAAQGEGMCCDIYVVRCSNYILRVVFCFNV